MNTLIIPCAGRSTRFKGVRPKWMLTHPDGKLMLQKVIEGLELSSVDRIIVTIVKEHCEKYAADIVVRQALGDDVEICILEGFTPSQSETIALTLKKMDVRGSFISKDSDGLVNVSIEEFDNLLVGADLRKYLEVTNVAGKSFIVLNEQHMVIDIIEKSICSNIICIGVYGFRSAAEFLEMQKIVKDAWSSEKGEIYLSHIISYMLGQKRYFSYIEATGYEDWGLMSAWRRQVNRMRTFFIDVDGVVFKNKGRYGSVTWDDEDIPLKNNVNAIKKLAEEGAMIIFCTARPESQRPKLERSLAAHGIPWQSIVMGCNHSQRVIINDFANTNPYPACRAINIPRDCDDLDKYVFEN